MNSKSRWQIAIILALLLSSIMWELPMRAASQEKGRPVSAAVEEGQTPEVSEQIVSEMPINSGYESPGNSHKIQVRDAEKAKELLSGSGKLVASYGEFQIIEVDNATLKRVRKEVGVELRDEYNLVMLNSGAIDTTTEEAMQLRRRVESAGEEGKRMHLIQFAGPIRPEWYEELKNTGVEIVNYIPSNAYLVYGDGQSIGRLKKMAKKGQVQWEGGYSEEFRIHPKAVPSEKERAINPQAGEEAGIYQIQLFADARTNAETLSLIESVKQETSAPTRNFPSQFVTVFVKATANSVKQIASRPDVISVQLYRIPEKLDERQNRIITGQLTGNAPTPGDHFAWLAARGFTQAQFDASGFGVDVSDSGIEQGQGSPANNPPVVIEGTHFALRQSGLTSGASRILYKRLEGSPNGAGSTLAGCDGHGNLNAHIIAGHTGTRTMAPHADAQGFRYGLGVAPFVRVGSSVIFDPNIFTSPIYQNLQSRAYRDGMRVSSNSWGAAVGGAYNSDSQAYDALTRDAQPATGAVPAAGNQEMVMVFAAGNSGPGANTVGSPGTAKNVITVGAAENVHPFGAADQCAVADTGADSANDIIGFSSRGPCDDGRQKPEIMAPGTHVTGGVFQATLSDAGTGLAGACFDAGGVCAGPGTSNFFPVGQQFYTASSGTSHSTPAVAGGAALLRQFFINNSLTPPSAAMSKAFLTNSARYMTGVSANDNLFSPNQGMGEMNLGLAFDGTSRILKDQLSSNLFTASGQSRTITGNITDPSKPFRVSLAWTDPPGSTTGNAFVNNLDLTVTVGGQTYRGNVFSGANSVTGGTADIRNNLESVFLPAGVSGPFTITVTATNIAGDGVPGNATMLDQDYALVAYNATEVAQAVIAGAGSMLVTEGCTPANGVLDPGETVTVNLALQNAGTLDAMNVMATLQTTGGVTMPSAVQNYGTLVAGGPAVTRPFTFTVDPALACGSVVTATLSISGGVTGTVTYNFQTGVLAVAFAENFDGVTAPALPAGWVATRVTGTIAPWATVTTSSNTAPNSIFTADPPTVADNRIDTPAFMVTSSAARLNFSHRYGLENTFDGGVLEISVGGGPFTDIIAAGGSFVSGGYTGAISTAFSNPIGGRQAWTGTLSAFSPVSVNLPASAAGQMVQLRFRMGSDTSVSGTGWFVDSIQVLGGFVCTTPCGGAGGQVGGDHTSVYVADGANNRIQRTTDAGMSWTVIGTGGAGTAPGRFNNPRGVTSDSKDMLLFVADTNNNRIQRSTNGGTSWEVVVYPGTGVGRVNAPAGIVYDEANDVLYVSEIGSLATSRIQSLPSASTAMAPAINQTNPGLTVFAGATGGTALGKVNVARGLAVDTMGNLYVADTGNNRIQVYNVMTTTWSIFQNATLGNALGKVSGPRGVYVDNNNNVFVADTVNNRIQLFNGMMWSSFATASAPEGVVATSDGNIFMSDTGLNRLLRKPLMGTTSTPLGGIGTAPGRFNSPAGLR